MKRRSVLQTLLGALFISRGTLGADGAPPRTAQPPSAGKGPIQLNCDLAVDPAKVAGMLRHFETTFKPTAQRQKGYIDLTLLELRTAVRGAPPAGCRFRFALTFQSEELRQVWIASADHQRVWPPIEDALLDKNFNILVYDVH